MDNDKLIAVFEMLCDRLGRIEEGVSKNTESLKESQRTRLGRLDSQLFGWKSNVYREPDLERDSATLTGHVLESEGARLIHAAFISFPDDSCPPKWYHQEIIEDTVPKRLQLLLHDVDIDNLVRLEKKLVINEGGCILCSQIGLKSSYIYVSEEIAQRVLEKHKDSRLSGIRLASDGLWVWSRYPLSGLTIDDMIDIVQKAFDKLGLEQTRKNRIEIQPIDTYIAEVAAMVDCQMGIRPYLHAPTLEKAVKVLKNWFRFRLDDYLDSHEGTKYVSKYIRQLIEESG